MEVDYNGEIDPVMVHSMVVQNVKAISLTPRNATHKTAQVCYVFKYSTLAYFLLYLILFIQFVFIFSVLNLIQNFDL